MAFYVIVKCIEDTVHFSCNGFQWLCTGCTHGLPTMKNMTRTLNEIKQSNEVRMNAIEKKLGQVCETIEARISK